MGAPVYARVAVANKGIKFIWYWKKKRVKRKKRRKERKRDKKKERVIINTISDMEPEVVCVSQKNKADGFGELQGGFVFQVSLGYAAR